MSYYRDDREAACRRIEALEAKLREREEELAAQGADLSARDEENARLRDEVEQARGLSPRRGLTSVTTVWAARSVGVALLMCSAMGGAGFFMSTPPGPPVDPGAFEAERHQILVDETGEAEPLVDLPRVSRLEVTPVEPNAVDPAKALDEYALKRSLEQKMLAGRASEADLKMLRAICSHMADRECRDRAARQLAILRAGR